MATIASSKLTAQNQISVPAEVRRRLGLRPGSVIEWKETGEGIVVRPAVRYTSAQIHAVLFPEGPPKPAKTLRELKEGIADYVRENRERRGY